jgi:hypothetical protein
VTLDGRLIYLPAARPAGTVSLEVDGEPTRVRHLRPVTSADTVYEIRANTTAVSLLAPSHHVGVDVVILADCSGSMSTRDLTVSAEAPPPATSLWRSAFSARGSRERYQSRSDVLVQALLDLLDRRLLTAGTTGRMALVAFGSGCELRFPRASEPRGMVEIDENTTEETRAQCRQAVRDLIPNTNWGTDIGQALQFAASHLSNHGKPGNDRLIVLVSDGAHWEAKGEAETGKLLEDGFSEPISLMDTLHTRMGIRLHAIGISNLEIYQRWVRSTGRDPQTSLINTLIPNHRLLEELLRVGGGDPARTGDASVLEEYFRGLGEGVTTRVVVTARRAQESAGLWPEEQRLAAALNAAGATKAQTSPQAVARLSVLRDQLKDRYSVCNKYARALSGHFLIDAPFGESTEVFDHTMVTPVTDDRTFRLFQTDIYKIFDERLAPDIRIPAKTLTWPAPFPAIKKYIHGGKFTRLGPLRHVGVHVVTEPARIKEQADALRFFVGVPIIEPADAARWLELQIKVLELVNATWGDMLEMLRQAVEQEKTAAASQPTDTLIQW